MDCRPPAFALPVSVQVRGQLLLKYPLFVLHIHMGGTVPDLLSTREVSVSLFISYKGDLNNLKASCIVRLSLRPHTGPMVAGLALSIEGVF